MEYSIDNSGVRIRNIYRIYTEYIRYPCPNTDTYFIIRIPYIPLNKLYIVDESIIQITITLVIINFMNNLF